MTPISQYSSTAAVRRRQGLYAAAALLTGAAIYAFCRGEPTLLAQNLWPAQSDLLRPLKTPIPWITGSLPSFVHAYALLMASAAIAIDAKLSRAALWGGVLICLSMEAIQAAPLAQAIAAAAAELPALKGVASYAIAGTFDVFDVLAISVASSAATWQVANMTKILRIEFGAQHASGL